MQIINSYQKKVLLAKKTLVLYALKIMLLLALIFGLSLVSDLFQKDHDLEMSNLKSIISDLTSKSANIETKINDAKRFKKLWISADEKKKNFNGIKVADINGNFYSLTEKYGIINPAITISVPAVLKEGIYKQLQVFDLNFINCSISFKSITDEVAIDFIDSFIKKLPGYIVINNLSITREKKEGYSDQDLVGISDGSFAGITSVKINFSWYFLQYKSIGA